MKDQSFTLEQQVLIRQFEDSDLPFIMTDTDFAVIYANACIRDDAQALSVPDAVKASFPAEDLISARMLLLSGDSVCLQISKSKSFGPSFHFSPLVCESGITAFFAVVSLPEKAESLHHIYSAGTSAFSAAFRQSLSEIFASVSVMSRKISMRGDVFLNEYLSSINQSCYIMLRNLQNLTCRTGAAHTPSHVVDIWELLSELMEACVIVLQSSDITLSYKFPDGTAPVRCDFDVISVAVINFISNACHSNINDCRITVTGRLLENYAAITVSDNGSGMTPEQLDKLFIPYTARGLESMIRSGMGVGASTAKRIISDAGGTIAVDSSPETGTAVSFTLPLYDGAPDPRLPAGCGLASYLEDQFSPLYVGLCDIVSPPLK